MSDYFLSQCTKCGKDIYLHLGLTVGDIEDNPELTMCDKCVDYERGNIDER